MANITILKTLNTKLKNSSMLLSEFYIKKMNLTASRYFVFYLRDNTQQNLVRKDIIKKSLTIENLAKSRKIRDGHLNEAIYEILESSSRAMQTTRVNAWLFDLPKKLKSNVLEILMPEKTN
jgi:hypothetical protein